MVEIFKCVCMSELSVSPEEYQMECSSENFKSTTASVTISDADRNLMAREMQATIGGTDPVAASSVP